ncbi:MAG: S8 family serine peptidase, partial [Candidatus Hydrogenedentota bacterium]
MRDIMVKTCVLFIALFLVTPQGALRADQFGDMFDPDHVLVKFKELPSRKELNNFAVSQGLRLDRAIPRIDVFRLRISGGQGVRNVLARLVADGRVEFAEPDYIRLPTYDPNDPLFQFQWDMTLMGLPSCWDVEKGQSSVIIAVLDTGIDLDHPDHINQLWENSDEIPGNGIDDDGNGYTDDFNGYDFAGDGLFPLPGAEDPIPDDTDVFIGHGTHVSGTIGAEQDNFQGISGEAPGTKLMAVRVLGGLLGFGYSSDICEGIVYATDNGASVINMSLGGTAKSLTEYNTLKYAWDHNVFIAAAAGNDGNAGNPISYPAAYVFAMSVGATDSFDTIASFSTHNEFVEISAPGVEILSTVRGGGYESSDWSGTSMATPHVAGLAALLYSMYSDIENWQVRWMLQSGVIDRGIPGWDEFYGFGRADCGEVIGTLPPSNEVLRIIAPPEGVQFAPKALIALLWNPVEGASRYRITAGLPGGGTRSINTLNTYYTVPPVQPVPAGTYDVTVEALDA